MSCVFFQAEDGIRDLVRSRGLGDVYKRQMKARLVVVGDADFASTGGIANAANLYLLTSSVNLSLIHI